jgi:hypothetical protein
MPTVQFDPARKNKGGRPKNKPTAKHDPARIIQKVIPARERIEKLAELSRGITVSETDKKGEVHVYTLPPNEKAIRQLNEYAWGKPVERSKIDVTSDGKPMAVALLPPIVHPKKDKKKE